MATNGSLGWCMASLAPGSRMSQIGCRIFSCGRVSSQRSLLTSVGRKSSEVLKSEYRKAGKRLKSRTSRVEVSGLLPVSCDSERRNSRIDQMNT